MITEPDYNKLCNAIKKQYPDNYRDIAHDLILKHKDIDKCFKGWQYESHKYGTSYAGEVKMYNGVYRYCKECKEQLPIDRFGELRVHNKVYLRNQCEACRYKLDKNKLKRVQEWRERNKEYLKQKNKEYRERKRNFAPK